MNRIERIGRISSAEKRPFQQTFFSSADDGGGGKAIDRIGRIKKEQIPFDRTWAGCG
jgi:hypothetical protein